MLQGEITLSSSKSISNRVLIMEALSGEQFDLQNLSNAKDTVILQNLLRKINDPLLDAEDAGTVYRFLTAFLAWRGKNQVLIGNKRMCERPIGLLVDALNELGADVRYVGKKGFPPLQMKANQQNRWGNKISIGANISSQYISALLMLAPLLPRGLELVLEGKITSRPYISMTLDLMKTFGILSLWHQDTIKIPHQDYEPQTFTIEADWSSASYFYSLAAIAPKANIQLNGLQADSLQGDSILVEMMRPFGVESTFNQKGVLLTKIPPTIQYFKQDFSDCPDIAQTMAVLCAALDIPAELSGLETLLIKETDRTAAIQTELQKLGCEVEIKNHTLLLKKGIQNKKQTAKISTYNDHRMAMAFAPLVLILKKISIENKEVVEKSYPGFWKDLEVLGLEQF